MFFFFFLLCFLVKFQLQIKLLFQLDCSRMQWHIDRVTAGHECKIKKSLAP